MKVDNLLKWVQHTLGGNKMNKIQEFNALHSSTEDSFKKQTGRDQGNHHEGKCAFKRIIFTWTNEL